MAMVGSVVTHDMFPNRIYAGVPAKDVTEKLGPQFEPLTTDQKAARLQRIVDAFLESRPEYRDQLIVARGTSERRPGVCSLDVSTRTYTRTYREAEVAFFKAHVPLVKFTPDGEPPFVMPRHRG